MTRFSLSLNHSVQDSSVVFASFCPLKDTYDEDDACSSTSSDDDDDKDCVSSERNGSGEEEDEEDPHPLGFTGPNSYGKTRFGLAAPADAASQHLSQTDDATTASRLLTDDRHDDYDALWESFFSDHATSKKSGLRIVPVEQSFPPVNKTSYIPCSIATTSSLLRHYQATTRLQRRTQQYQPDVELHKFTSLIRDAINLDSTAEPSTTNSYKQSEQQQPSIESVSSQKLWELGRRYIHDSNAILERMKAERLRLSQEDERAVSSLRSLIAEDEASAQSILDKDRRDQKERDRADASERQRLAEEEVKLLKIKREEEAKRQWMDKAEEESRLEKVRQGEALAAKKKEAIERLAAEKAKKTEYVARAQKLVDKLVEVRASLQTFESNKAVAKRRLTMKKVRGKLNTLQHDSANVEKVSLKILEAIQVAKAEDEAVKQQLAAGTVEGLTSDMGRGKRYLVDLLSSDVIVRVQAEGFNGTRGDGFPLANAMAKVSVETKEIVLLLEAHIFTACPTAIPKLPSTASDSSEAEVMEGLGMMKDKNGNFETFDRFLARTEGIISIMAEIMSSTPTNHQLMGGHEGAIKWLDRFLDFLPPDQTPLPIVTAPALVAFLTAAGHMLANKFPDAFKPMLDAITTDIVSRVDVGTIGQPSATRLKKVLEGGFDKFRTKLPQGAIPELYDGKEGTGTGASSVPTLLSQHPQVGGSQQPSSNTLNTFGSQSTMHAFGGTAAAPSSSGGNAPLLSGQPIGAGPNTSFASGNFSVDKRPCSFFAQGNCRNGDNCPFSHDVEIFGGEKFQNDGFGRSTDAEQATVFGGGNRGKQPLCNFFAQGNCRNGDQCPFSHDMGDSGNGNNFNSQANAFGQQQQHSDRMSFVSNSASTFSGSTNPFSGNTSSTTFGASPFAGGGVRLTDPSPFGERKTTKPVALGAAPFGGGDTLASSAPFGGVTGNAPANSTFGGGAAMTTSPFGGSGGSMMFAPSPFGGGGTIASAPTPFGGVGFNAPAPSPFSGGASTTSAQSQFGGGAPSGPSASPFGEGHSAAAPAPSSFGGGGSTMNPLASPFGGTPGPSQFGGGGSTMNPLASPFEKTSDPSPFGGGSSDGGGAIGGKSDSSFFGVSHTNPSPFGSGLTNPSPFGSGQANPSPFGSGQANPSPFGSGQANPTPFGSGPVNPSPFGSGATYQSPFGGGQASHSSFSGSSAGNQSSFGDNSNKPPCKFFAQGRCRKGANCPFSHSIPAAGRGSSSFGGGGFGRENSFERNGSFTSNSPFGGPRR